MARKAAGNAALTSANPPVLIKGATSEVANRTFNSAIPDFLFKQINPARYSRGGRNGAAPVNQRLAGDICQLSRWLCRANLPPQETNRNNRPKSNGGCNRPADNPDLPEKQSWSVFTASASCPFRSEEHTSELQSPKDL